MGALLYYAHTVDNKLLVALSTIGGQLAAATEKTNEAINQLLDYCATYPNDNIVYRSSDMILCAHLDAGFHNESRGRSRARAHMFLVEDEPIPKWNGPVLTIAQIMNICHHISFRSQARSYVHHSTSHGIATKYSGINGLETTTLTHSDRQLSGRRCRQQHNCTAKIEGNG